MHCQYSLKDAICSGTLMECFAPVKEEPRVSSRCGSLLLSVGFWLTRALLMTPSYSKATSWNTRTSVQWVGSTSSTVGKVLQLFPKITTEISPLTLTTKFPTTMRQIKVVTMTLTTATATATVTAVVPAKVTTATTPRSRCLSPDVGSLAKGAPRSTIRLRRR